MKARLRTIYYKHIAPKALVLMYHRVAEPESDVWEVAVSPTNFEQQLQVLKNSYNVIPLNQLVESVKKRSIKRNSVAITFDDGYVDNYLAAKPLLEKYGMPATFFISSGNVGQQKEFWWDELEHLVLFSDTLPAAMALEIAGNKVVFDLQEEVHLSPLLRQQHAAWKACEEQPPTLRSTLFYKLWENLKPLPPAEQHAELQKIRAWAGSTGVARDSCTSMSREQLRELGQAELFDLGAHTVSHAALAFHPAKFQEQELEENRRFLKEITGNEIALLAYPYGNYNNESIAVADKLGFEAAFTTEDKAVVKFSQCHRLGRFQVKDLDAREFRKHLQEWKYSI